LTSSDCSNQINHTKATIINLKKQQYGKAMLQTFKATLRGDSLEWGEEVGGNLRVDRPVQVLVTILEEPIAKSEGRGQRMADALEKLAQARAFAEIDPVVWQQDVRQDRELPGQNE
jgi:hypothetical protein